MKYSIYKDWNEYKSNFNANFTIDDEYVICGFGGGFRLLKRLFPNVKIKYILDANANLSSDEYDIISYDKVSDSLFSKRKFIITPGCEYYSEIKRQITDIGADPINIASINEIMFFWGMNYSDKKLYSSACSLLLLTGCNLRCQGCGQYVPYEKKFLYMDIETIKANIDCYFSVFDFVGNLMPIGGETLLYKELEEVLNYINQKYSGHYNEIQIFTNGIITPSDRLAKTMSQTKDLRVIISDYSNAIDGKSHNIIDTLEKYRINYTLNAGFGQSSENRWFDLGNPNIFKNEEDSVTAERFSKCSLICNSLINKKIYCCAPSCHSIIGDIHVKSEEFCLDLEEIKSMKDEKYDIIGQFLLGFPTKGYLENCKYCNGYGQETNSNYILAGKQA